MKYVFQLLAFSLCTTTSLWGQGYQVNLQGQVQQGMGGAGTALMQDASALFFNPGGASFVEGNQISVGMTPTFANGVFHEAGTNVEARTNSPMGTPFSVYGLFGLKDNDRLKFGLGIYTPFGSTVQWEDGWVGRFALTRLKLLSIFVQPTVSYKITDKIGIGAGFVYSYGQVNLQKDLPILDANNEYASVELAGTGTGFGFNAAIYIEPNELVSFGLSYRSQVNMKLPNGEATFYVPASVEDKFPSGKFISQLPLPQVATGSIAFHPNEAISLVLDVNYVGWHAYDTLAFDYENNTASLEDTKSARNYKDIVAFRFGGQYTVKEKIKCRAGIAYGISPVQNGYVTPETPDANRFNYTIGLGYSLGDHLELDASLLFTQVSRTDTNLETNLSGEFKTRVYAPGLSITYKL
jgi:long-chain fatty acid transport protein